MHDVISIGDSTEDVFVRIEDAKVLCNVNHKDCKICFSYASKIAAKEVHKLIGGNASNSAIGSARLGLKSAFYCEVGGDDTGRRIFGTMKKNKVSTKYFNVNKKTSTNYSVVINLGAERTILVYHVKRKYKLPDLSKSKWVYLTSMSEGCERIYNDMIKYIKKNKVKLCFNPGTHQLNSGLKVLKPLLNVTEVLCLNKEEVQLLVKSNSENYKALLKKMKNLGPEICILTDGPKGAWTYDGSKFYYCGIMDVPILERTGCGDSFTVAFVCSLVYGNEIKEALRWGMANSASVVQHVGPHQGLLDLSGMKRYLNEFKNVKAKVI